jgi:hypothetical protein
VRQKLIDFGGSPKIGTPQDFRDRVDRDITSLRKVVIDKRIEME